MVNHLIHENSLNKLLKLKVKVPSSSVSICWELIFWP